MKFYKLASLEFYHNQKENTQQNNQSNLYTIPRLFSLVAATLISFLVTNSATASNWWLPQHDYRISLTVDANGYARTDKPVEVELNFTNLMSSAGQSGAFEPNSLRVVELGSGGGIVDNNVSFQFDSVENFNASTNAAGTLILLLSGDTNASSNRAYHVYFDVQGKGFIAPVFPDQTSVSTVIDEGQSSFRVQTTNATYYYQKEAGGFSSLVDVNNNDWINFHPTPVNSPAGSYRGIPNMVHPEGKLHPGTTGHTTTLVHTGPLKTTIRTVIDTDGNVMHDWDVLWEFFPTYARMTVNDIEHEYWFLYEGTPGGDLEPDLDFVVRSDGTSTLASKKWTNDLPGEEWVYFADPGVNRSLYLVNYAKDTAVDSYKAMSRTEGDMTVFGFGRQDTNKLLNQLPASFTIGLMETTVFDDAANIVRSAYKPLMTSIGVLELNFSDPAVIEDADEDGITDNTDNCTLIANPNQQDTDGDGFGNRCDADLDNNGSVSFGDLNIFRDRFGTNDPDADFDGNGSVSFGDLNIFRDLFGKPPGPSGIIP